MPDRDPLSWTEEQRATARANLRNLRLTPSSPVITIFVRHAPKCKYRDDEFCKRCNCRKHLRWSSAGKQYRRKAGTRSWAEAEEKKRELEDQLSGRIPEVKTEQSRRDTQACIDTFLQDKKVQGVTASVVGKYTRELARLREYCARNGVYTVQGITRELLSGFCATWSDLYPSSYTRAKVRERVRSFLRYCYEVQWIPRIPTLPKIKIEEPPTLPLSADEYKRLLKAIKTTITKDRQTQVHALIQLMRYSGLAIRDALTLKRSGIIEDKSKGLHRIVTARQKTGTHVSVPIHPAVARELLAVPTETRSMSFGRVRARKRALRKAGQSCTSRRFSR